MKPNILECSNKYDNKIYIMITFCGLFFAFIVSLLDKLVEQPFPKTTNQGILFVTSIIIFIVISICYLLSMIVLVLGLRPIKMQRLNPSILIQKSLFNKPSVGANMLATKKYIEFVLINNATLQKAYKRISLVTTLMSVVVLLSFIEYILLLFM